MLGVLYALLLIESVLYTFLLTETMATFVGISVLGGILWRRANRWGAVARLVVGSLPPAREPAASVESLFERLHTSSDEATEGKSRPLLLVDALHLRAASGGGGWRAYRGALGGFSIG